MHSPILQIALDLLVHGLQHFTNGQPLDNRLTILHLDQAIELSLKEKVRQGGKPIMRTGGKESISLYESYKHLDDLGIVIPEKPNLELLHEQRNQIQHLFSSPDESITRFHVDNALYFLCRFYADEFNVIILDFIPSSILEHQKLKYLESLEKLRNLFDSSEISFKNGKFLEASSSLLAALDLTLQIVSEKKEIELEGESTQELLNDAEAKKILNKKGVSKARIIVNMNNDILNSKYPSEKDFLLSISEFRKETI